MHGSHMHAFLGFKCIIVSDVCTFSRNLYHACICMRKNVSIIRKHTHKHTHILKSIHTRKTPYKDLPCKMICEMPFRTAGDVPLNGITQIQSMFCTKTPKEELSYLLYINSCSLLNTCLRMKKQGDIKRVRRRRKPW
jgi:hypothetical protein